MGTAVQDIATVLHMLQHLKEKVPPSKWESTALPIIAAPRDWLTKIAVELGMDGDVEPAMIHGCQVVRNDELKEPVMVDWDGKVYPISIDWTPPMAAPQPPSPIRLQ